MKTRMRNRRGCRRIRSEVLSRAWVASAAFGRLNEWVALMLKWWGLASGSRIGSGRGGIESKAGICWCLARTKLMPGPVAGDSFVGR